MQKPGDRRPSWTNRCTESEDRTSGICNNSIDPAILAGVRKRGHHSTYLPHATLNRVANFLSDHATNLDWIWRSVPGSELGLIQGLLISNFLSPGSDVVLSLKNLGTNTL